MAGEMMETHDQIRAEFEEWAIDTGNDNHIDSYDNELEMYNHYPTQFGYEVWQAAKASAWRPISEAPKDGTEILVYGVPQYGKPFITTAAYRKDLECFMHNYNTSVAHDFLTHFMPLPTPPAKQEK